MGALKMSPGVGIRARTDRRTIARLDWAWGSEGHRIVLDMGPCVLDLSTSSPVACPLNL